MMWNELGISGGTAIVILIALYFVIKWAVKNGIKEAYSAIKMCIRDRDRCSSMPASLLFFTSSGKAFAVNACGLSALDLVWILL